MISLERNRSTVIDPKFRGPQLTASSLKLVRDQRAIRQQSLDKHDFDSSVWKKAKPQLLIESVDKCSYCEAPISAVSYGDVEHYRPKSKYWWLAYCVDNYLASCAICNQRFKKARFPYRNSKMRAPIVRKNSTDTYLGNLSENLVPDPLDTAEVAAFETMHRDERPLLLNPYVDNPESFFGWRADLIVEEVELVPRPGVPMAAEFVDAAADVYGLNRNDLLVLRFNHFFSYFTHKLTLQDPGISAATQNLNQRSIDRMVRSSGRFAGMIRFFESTGLPQDWENNGFLVQ
jgi:hypothetical protein